MRVRRWKPMSGFPIALLAVSLLAQGSQGVSKATSDTTAAATKVSDESSSPFEAAAGATPTISSTELPVVGTDRGDSESRNPSEAPPSTRRYKRMGVFPSWLREYDVYDELAALYSVDTAKLGRRSGTESAGSEAIIARQRPRAPETSPEAVFRKQRKRRRRRKGGKASAAKGGQITEGSKLKVREKVSQENRSTRTKQKRKVKRVKERGSNDQEFAGKLSDVYTSLQAPEEPKTVNKSRADRIGRDNEKESTEDINVSKASLADSSDTPNMESTTVPFSTETEAILSEAESSTPTSTERFSSMFSDETRTTEPPSSEESTESLHDSMKMEAALSKLLDSSMETTPSSLEDTSFEGMDNLREHISRLAMHGSDQVESSEESSVSPPHRHPRIRVPHPEDLSPSDVVEMINADMEDVIAADQEDMAKLAREESKESRALSDEDDEEDAEISIEPEEDPTTEGPDETEMRERYRESEHEEVPEPPTRPNYTHEGMWAKPPPHVEIDFVPLQVLAQVRRYDTVRHLTPEDALAEATTDEEVINAPRLKEVVSHRKTSEVYSEEGYEDSGYDHGGYNKEGEHHEVVPGFEASAIMIKAPDEEEASESRDHVVAGSQQRGTRLALPGVLGSKESSAIPAEDLGRNRTKHGSQKTTRGSWSITQVTQDDDGRSVVLQEGGNITRPTTLRPVFPTPTAGRYAEQYNPATQQLPPHTLAALHALAAQHHFAAQKVQGAQRTPAPHGSQRTPAAQQVQGAPRSPALHGTQRTPTTQQVQGAPRTPAPHGTQRTPAAQQAQGAQRTPAPQGTQRTPTAQQAQGAPRTPAPHGTQRTPTARGTPGALHSPNVQRTHGAQLVPAAQSSHGAKRAPIAQQHSALPQGTRVPAYGHDTTPSSRRPSDDSTSSHQRQKSPGRKRKKKRKGKKGKESKKKASGIHSQLLGFKYPADRKKPRSKGKNNSPLAKAKRKRKMKERAKKRRKLSQKRAERERKRLSAIQTDATRNKSQDNAINKSSQIVPTKDTKQSSKPSNSSGKLVDLHHNQPQPAETLYPNHRYDNFMDPKHMMALMRGKPSYDIAPPKFEKILASTPDTFSFTKQTWPEMEVENLLKPQRSTLPSSMSTKWEKHLDKQPNFLRRPTTVYDSALLKPVKPVHFKIESILEHNPENRKVKIVETAEGKSIHMNRTNVVRTHPHESSNSQYGEEGISGRDQNAQAHFLGSFKKPIFLDETESTTRSGLQEASTNSADFVVNKWKPISIFPNPSADGNSSGAVLTWLQTMGPPTHSLRDKFKTPFSPPQRRFDRSVRGFENVSHVADLSIFKTKASKNSDQSESVLDNLGNYTKAARKFPKTEALQQLETRVNRNMSTGSVAIGSISTNIKHVPPLIKTTDPKTNTKVSEQQKVRLPKVMDFNRWRAQSKLNNTEKHAIHPNKMIPKQDKNSSEDFQQRPHVLRTALLSLSAPTTEQLMSAPLRTDEVLTNQNFSDLNTSVPNLPSINDDKTSPPNISNADLHARKVGSSSKHSGLIIPDDSDTVKGASMRRSKFALPDVRTDLRKYPFYKAPTSEKLTSYTPLRYATNPYDVPTKTEGGMEFYESREKLIYCKEPRKPENVIPERDEDGEWNEKPQPDGPRMGSLGDAIGCMRVKLFGENPLDNPFFKETSVGLPQETALVGALVDAGGTPAPKLYDQFGFYSDILENIRHASIGPNPADVKNRPYIRVGASPFDSEEASSEVTTVRVAYRLPESHTGEKQSLQSEDMSNESEEGLITRKEKQKDDIYSAEGNKYDSLSTLAKQLQESAEQSPSSTEEIREGDKDSSASTSVEYFVDADGQPVSFYSGSTLEKSKESKHGRKNIMYHNIVRAPSSESTEYTITTANNMTKQGTGEKKLNGGNRGQNSFIYNNADRKNIKQQGDNLNSSGKKRNPTNVEQSYKKALETSKAMTEIRKNKIKQENDNFTKKALFPPVSSSVLKKLKKSNVSLDEFLHGSPPPNRKNMTRYLDSPSYISEYRTDDLNKKRKRKDKATRKYNLGSSKSEPNPIDLRESREDIISSESADFVRPKNKKDLKDKNTYVVVDEGGAFGEDEYKKDESFSYTVPIRGDPKEERKPKKAKPDDSIRFVSFESISKEEKAEEVAPKSIHIGLGDDSVVEVPTGSAEQSMSGNLKSKVKSKGNLNMKGASTEMRGSEEGADISEVDAPDDDEDYETPESNEKATNEDSGESNERNSTEKSTKKDQKGDEDSSSKEQQPETVSRPVTYEEFKAGLTEEELAFFRDDDDDEDDLGLEDISRDEDEADEESKIPKKPTKKTVKASKVVHIIKPPDSDDEYGGTRNRGVLDSEEDKITVNYTTNLEADFKPEKKVKVVKSQISEEKFPEDYDDDYDENDDDFDEKKPEQKNYSGQNNLKSDSSETQSASTEEGSPSNNSSHQGAKKTDEEDYDQPDDDVYDYYEDDENDDYEDASGEKPKNSSSSMHTEESREQPNVTTDIKALSNDESSETSTDNTSDDRNTSRATVRAKDGGEEQEKESDSSTEDEEGDSGSAQNNEDTEEEDEDIKSNAHNGTTPDDGPDGSANSGDILPFESAESAVEQKSNAELAFDKKVEAGQASVFAPVELTESASNTKLTSTSIDASSQQNDTKLTKPSVKTQLGVSSMLIPIIMGSSTPVPTANHNHAVSNSSLDATLPVGNWVRVSADIVTPPEHVTDRSTSTSTMSSVIMTIPSSSSRHHG